MLRNYLTIALRNLAKHKAFSFINILGLAIGMAACLLILQYVVQELSYDTFHEKGDRIYRLRQDRYNKGELSTQWAAGAAGVGPAFKEAFPEIEDFAKFISTGGVMSYGDKKFREEKMYFANASFFNVFSFPLSKGDAKTALAEPYTAVISQSIARKYFGDEDPMGKTIFRNKNQTFKITGVFADVPENSHLKFDVLFSFDTFVKMTSEDANTYWNWDGFYTYVLLKPGTDAQALEAKFADYIEKTRGEELKGNNEWVVYYLQPLKDIHLYSDYMMEAEANGDGKSVYFLLIIAFFIIGIAWVNYINLATARSIDRAREVGVRKVLGSYRMQLVRQFMFESVLINLMAVMLACLLVGLTLPLFNALTGKSLSFTLFTYPLFWLTLTALFMIGAFLSGLYPAFVLSAFQPVQVLKGKLVGTRQGTFLRRGMVVVQFIASAALIIGTFTVYRQLTYMRNQALGVDINHTLVLKGPNVSDSTYQQKLSAFKSEMERYPAVKAVTASTDIPGHKVGWNAGGIRRISDDPSESNQYRVIGVDYDYVDAYGLKVIAGRNFSEDFRTDTAAVLFNEAAIRLMDFETPESALNERIEFWGDTYTIVGVLENYHQETLRQMYDPLIFRLIPSADNYYSIKLAAGGKPLEQIPDVIRTAQARWEQFFPGNPFEYFFLEEHFDKQYRADQQFGQVFGTFAALAIFVACLGLFGLASFTATQRTKEIGIRKVLGANIQSILLLLSKDFIRLVLVAFVIAIPIAYYVMKQWLANYAFRIEINWWLFVLPGILVLLIALLTVSIQSVKAASANPIDSLRNE